MKELMNEEIYQLEGTYLRINTEEQREVRRLKWKMKKEEKQARKQVDKEREISREWEEGGPSSAGPSIVTPPSSIYYIPERYGYKKVTRTSINYNRPKLIISDSTNLLPLDPRTIFVPKWPLPMKHPYETDKQDYLPEFKMLMKKHVTIGLLGHSMVGRVRPFLPENPTSYSELRCFGQSGGVLQVNGQFEFDGTYAFKRWIKYQPDLTLFMLGGNDIDDSTNVNDLLVHYKTLVSKIQWPGTFVIIQVERRFRMKYGGNVEFYNFKRELLNNIIAKEFPNQYLSTYLYMEAESSRDSDGVHLTESANQEFAKQIVEKIRYVCDPDRRGSWNAQVDRYQT
jgi:hypothetical protein